ncbi:uncharacterized protein LOC131681219 [Topomyia yanbarensis]|uniref:uncharacterized protein LOC131681219 n=1 Tax=Topomyia yanbarensis TaxID=2498891 RepID=UPI00273BC35B|nr:uncharacterized protein LOC131681219 [Topomyia yanbarensis]
MRLVITLVIMAVFGGVELAVTGKENDSNSKHTVTDIKMIRQTLEELIEAPGLQFIEYGPDTEEGYKYHLSAEKDKEFVVHTTGPVFIPINQSFDGSREEKDRKLLQLLIESSKIKSMDSVKNDTV